MNLQNWKMRSFTSNMCDEGFFKVIGDLYKFYIQYILWWLIIEILFYVIN